MNKSNYVEVRPNIWISKNDPLYEQKFNHYSSKVKNVGNLVTDSSPSDIKLATQKAQQATAASKNPTPKPQIRRRAKQKPTFSFLDWIGSWIQAGFLLSFIVISIFVFFYVFVIGFQ